MATATITADQAAVVAEIFIAAPPERVFQAITDPSQTSQWWGQKGMYRVTDWKADLRVGGKWSSAGVHADGSTFSVGGEYLDIDPPKRLVYTWEPSWSPSLKTTTVHWELETREVHGLQHRGRQKVGVGTLVKIRHEGFAGACKEADGHAQGWTRVLGWMQAFVEKGETVESRKEL